MQESITYRAVKHLAVLLNYNNMKALVFYITAVLTMILVCSMPSLTWLFLIFLDMLLITWCAYNISTKEFIKLTGYNIWYKMIG